MAIISTSFQPKLCIYFKKIFFLFFWKTFGLFGHWLVHSEPFKQVLLVNEMISSADKTVMLLIFNVAYRTNEEVFFVRECSDRTRGDGFKECVMGGNNYVILHS